MLIFSPWLTYQQVQEARQNHDDDAVKKAVNEYDEALERWGTTYRCNTGYTFLPTAGILMSSVA